VLSKVSFSGGRTFSYNLTGHLELGKLLSGLRNSLSIMAIINHLTSELNPIYHLLALLGTYHILHVSGVRVKKTFTLTANNAFELNKIFKILYINI
jgi:hypothetical protein